MELTNQIYFSLTQGECSYLNGNIETKNNTARMQSNTNVSGMKPVVLRDNLIVAGFFLGSSIFCESSIFCPGCNFKTSNMSLCPRMVPGDPKHEKCIQALVAKYK